MRRRPTSTRFLQRFILPSDRHGFIGRIYDLSIVSLHFDTYEQVCQHPDCKYALDVNNEVTTLAQRVESLNLVGNLLWPVIIPKDFKTFPISRHEWLTVTTDVFLMRYVSVVDCALLVANEVFECGIDRRRCTPEALKKCGVTDHVISILQRLYEIQGELRSERNARFHHGIERTFTDHELTFRTAAFYEHRARGLRGHDENGRLINPNRSFKEGLVGLQREFNRSARTLIRELDHLYDALGVEFEKRFVPRFRKGAFAPKNPS